VALLSAMLAFAANLAVIGFIYWRTHTDDARALRVAVGQEASILSDVYDSGGRTALDRAIGDTLKVRDPQYLAAIIDGSGRGVVGNVAALSSPGKHLREGVQTGEVMLRGALTPVEAGFQVRPLGRGAFLLSGRFYGERLSLLKTIERSLVIAVIISILLGLVCGLAIARYVGLRVDEIAGVANRITGGGDLSHRVPLSGSGDAFDALARQINTMLERIGTLMSELRMLTDSLAHDLRSPVGRLRARVDAALGAKDEERDALLGGVINEADALMRILTMVLEIGRSEAMTSRNQFAPLDPAGLVAELAEMYEPIAEDRAVALGTDSCGAPGTFFGHRQLLAQALTNLMDNALNYGSAGGEIVLYAGSAVTAGGPRLRLGVADRGPGIPPEAQAEARRRFGRLDSSRTKAGAGLGLALAEAVAHLHGGELRLEDNRPGLRAVLDLPCGPAASG
jgi:signal transduction histidine kinase